MSLEIEYSDLPQQKLTSIIKEVKFVVVGIEENATM